MRTIWKILIAIVVAGVLLWILIPRGMWSEQGSCYGVKVKVTTESGTFLTTNTWADSANPSRRIEQKAYWTYQEWSFYAASGARLAGPAGSWTDLKTQVGQLYGQGVIDQGNYGWFMCASAYVR